MWFTVYFSPLSSTPPNLPDKELISRVFALRCTSLRRQWIFFPDSQVSTEVFFCLSILKICSCLCFGVSCSIVHRFLATHDWYLPFLMWSLVSMKGCSCIGRDKIQSTMFIYFAFYFVTGILLFSLTWRKSKYGKPSRSSLQTIKWRQVSGSTLQMIDMISSWLAYWLVVLHMKNE